MLLWRRKGGGDGWVGGDVVAAIRGDMYVCMCVCLFLKGAGGEEGGGSEKMTCALVLQSLKCVSMRYYLSWTFTEQGQGDRGRKRRIETYTAGP